MSSAPANAASQAPVEPIAIIGMAGRFPGAADLDEFWQNLISGTRSFTTFTDEELLDFGEFPAYVAHPDYVPVRPVIDGLDMFDSTLFRMSPRQADVRDPQYRLFLEVSHAVLNDAGYDPATHSGAIGVYAGSNGNRYRIDSVEHDFDAISAVGWEGIQFSNWPDYMPTFVSYKLGLRGPSMAVQTACSTALVAVHQACTALRTGDCDMAIAGGSCLEMPLKRGYLYVEGGMNAREGIPRPFDADATGTNFGSGVGAVLLKSLDQAVAAGDNIYAVILGSAVNNDGDDKVGFTAPSVGGQSACVAAALTRARVDPRTVSYVEAHGTGTRLGDPIELAGITDAFRRMAGPELPTGYCGIGSVKSNVGHLGQAAGMASLIKAVLSLREQTIPPSVGFSRPTPEFRRIRASP